jgi:hypothetical protein
MFGCNSRYMCTFTGKKLSVCGFGFNARWITQAEEFPGAMPVSSMQGWDNDTVVVAERRRPLAMFPLPDRALGEVSSPTPHTPYLQTILGWALGL